MTTITLAHCEAEVCRLHDFFQDWFRGAIAENDNNFQKFAQVMGAGFFIIGPDGRLMELPLLTARLRRAYGQQPGIRIWTKNQRLHHQSGDITLCTYEEWQESAGQTTARLSSVLFQQAASAPHGIIWLHVHETWLKSTAFAE